METPVTQQRINVVIGGVYASDTIWTPLVVSCKPHFTLHWLFTINITGCKHNSHMFLLIQLQMYIKRMSWTKKQKKNKQVDYRE